MGAADNTTDRVALVVTAGARACAIRLEHVAEIMRPLAIEPVSGVPGFVRGVAVIRGEAAPVIDLAALLGCGENSASYGRFVSLKLGERRVVLGVDAVIGTMSLASVELRALPPLLRDLATEVIEAVGTRDAELLIVLRAARLVPAEVWTALAPAGATR